MSTAVKKTKYRASASSRGRERLQRVNRRFDLCAGILALLIVIAMIASFRQTYELGANRPEGFATWFLLFLAYLRLEIVGLVSWLFGLQDSALVHMLVERHQALALGVFDLAMLAAVWSAIRFYFGRRYGVNWVRTATTFLTILAVWGGFQLCCMAAVVIWSKGGFSPLHRHLRRETEPERVIIVKPDAEKVPEEAPMPKNP